MEVALLKNALWRWRRNDEVRRLPWMVHPKSGIRASRSTLITAFDAVLRSKAFSNPFMLRFLKHERGEAIQSPFLISLARQMLIEKCINFDADSFVHEMTVLSTSLSGSPLECLSLHNSGSSTNYFVVLGLKNSDF
jgi:hypothetical protein